jgi:hypothetical protein
MGLRSFYENLRLDFELSKLGRTLIFRYRTEAKEVLVGHAPAEITGSRYSEENYR